jgi:hypothetical protein
MKHLILILAYYNDDLLKRTLESMRYYIMKDSTTTYILENPSKNSDKIKNVIKKYNIDKHYICSENIGGFIFEKFCYKNIELLKKFDYISFTEGDVVVSKNSIEETIDILENNEEIIVSSIRLELNTQKYSNLPINAWVPKLTRYKNFYKGHTGFQFITMKINVLLDLLETLKMRIICNPIALGVSDFKGLSDTNLFAYTTLKNKNWGVTNLSLDHIGWEKYINKQEDYVIEKNNSVYRLRSNELLNKNFNLNEQII